MKTVRNNTKSTIKTTLAKRSTKKAFVSISFSVFVLAISGLGSVYALAAYNKTNIATLVNSSFTASAKSVPESSKISSSSSVATATAANQAKQEQETMKQSSSSANTVSQASQPTVQQATAASTSATATIPLVSIRGKVLYVEPTLTSLGKPAEIASQPTATWLGSWTGNIQASVNTIVTTAANQGKIATFVIYNIPSRDCGSYSAGGAASSANYMSWIRQIAAGIGARQALLVIEPDALAQIDCLDQVGQANRYALLSDAVSVFASQTKSVSYLDAGHPSWISVTAMAQRLQKANVAQAQGFSLNVSNFYTTAENITYGNQLSAKLNGKKFVVDTSRNGNGSNGQWCNPRGRALGERPTTASSGAVDAFLWIKTPGESDGTCNGGPNAGVWWDEYATELIKNSR